MRKILCVLLEFVNWNDFSMTRAQNHTYLVRLWLATLPLKECYSRCYEQKKKENRTSISTYCLIAVDQRCMVLKQSCRWWSKHFCDSISCSCPLVHLNFVHIITIRSSESLNETNGKEYHTWLKFIFSSKKKGTQKVVPNYMLKSLPPKAAVLSYCRGFSIAVPDANVMGLLILRSPTSKWRVLIWSTSPSPPRTV